MISRENIVIGIKASNREDLLNQLSDKLYRNAYVKDTFKSAIMAREKEYPTGLPTPGVQVALPHTDVAHVKKTGVLVATLKNPIKFKDMSNGIDDIDVELVFMLAVKDPKKQLILLQRFMNIFSNEKLLKTIKNSKDKNEIYRILVNKICD